MYAYQKTDCTLTVRDALTEFRTVTGLEQKMKFVRPEALNLMNRHDLVHVIFGLDTTLRHEAIVDIWTVFGTTARVTDMIEYLRLPEEKEILSKIGFWAATVTALRAVPDVAQVFWAAQKLNYKWPWSEHGDWLDRPLDKVRKEFGVTLLTV